MCFFTVAPSPRDRYVFPARKCTCWAIRAKKCNAHDLARAILDRLGARISVEVRLGESGRDKVDLDPGRLQRLCTLYRSNFRWPRSPRRSGRARLGSSCAGLWRWRRNKGRLRARAASSGLEGSWQHDNRALSGLFGTEHENNVVSEVCCWAYRCALDVTQLN